MNASVVRTRYFKLPNRKVYRKRRQNFKKKLKPCYICADWGHNGKFCPQVNTCSVCSKEESKNNVEEDHTSLFCLKCGGTGHAMFSCTNDYDPEDLKGVQCYICMDFGHLCCTENNTEGPTQASCYNCGQSGHHGFECTKMNVVTNKLQPVSSICVKCQKRVHSPEFMFASSKCISDEFEPSQTGELDNKLTATKNATLEKGAVPNKSTKRKRQKAQIAKLSDNKSTTA
ncbi:uncharacterized protein [Henckelia pumila]|uniref:uncharacterized protein n=1 Tax=Henckelia pumila TaxID=405737 RepID=UPI003C6DCB38